MAAKGWFSELWRFCLVGGSGVLVNLAVFQGALLAGVPLLPASALAFLVAATSNFFLNRAWTFRAAPSRDGNAAGWARFLAASLAGLGANLAVLYALTGWFGFGTILAQAGGIGTGTLLNYELSRAWVFRAKKPAPAPS